MHCIVIVINYAHKRNSEVFNVEIYLQKSKNKLCLYKVKKSTASSVCCQSSSNLLLVQELIQQRVHFTDLLLHPFSLFAKDL